MSFTTLWVLGSITIKLLVFSLLTKISPVSFAPAGVEERTAPARASARYGARMTHHHSLHCR
jgi:hypothetical protein